MRLSLSRRIVSYVIDAIPIFLIVVSLQSLFVGDLIKSRFENYDELAESYYTNLDIFDDQVALLREELELNIINELEYEIEYNYLVEDFNNENDEAATVVFSVIVTSLGTGFIIFTSLYYIYMLVLKGSSFGRRLMGGELSGRVTWYTILAREVVWKHFFWVLFIVFIVYVQMIGLPIPGIVFALFMISGITFDVALIGFTSKKMTLRDKLSQTNVTYRGVKYPF